MRFEPKYTMEHNKERKVPIKKEKKRKEKLTEIQNIVISAKWLQSMR